MSRVVASGHDQPLTSLQEAGPKARPEAAPEVAVTTLEGAGASFSVAAAEACVKYLGAIEKLAVNFAANYTRNRCPDSTLPLPQQDTCRARGIHAYVIHDSI